MAGGQIEMMHQIAASIGIGKNTCPRINGQLKNEATLIALTSRVHSHFHHALPDEAAVAIAREMSNGVEH
jgi:hypothetical protein